jgi:bzd-type benzoyl-CoA reductase N subunit
MNPFGPIKDVINDPLNYARRYKEKSGNPVIGFLCSYTPEEIIFAAGAHPFRLFASQEAIRFADSHLQTYSCSLVRGVLDDALAGRIDFLDGVVFPHTCDSIQRLSDIWRLNIPFGFHLDVVLPVKLNTASARQYMIDVINRFKSDLEISLGREITADALKESIALFNRIRADLRKIYAMRSVQPDILSGRELSGLVKASMLMDRRRLAELLADIVSLLETKRAAGSLQGRKRLILAGGLCSDPDVHSVVEDAGGVAVWDDFCTGSRYIEGDVPEDMEPTEAIAEKLIKRVVCPAKHADLHGRADHLITAAKERKADGIVFFLLKFCDPHAFDYPYLKNRLDAEGIPSALVEVDERPVTEGRIKTRLEAFLEMI